MRSLEREFVGYDDLWKWSIDEPERFWDSIWTYFDVKGSRPEGGSVLTSRAMPGASWFPGSKLSYAANVFEGRAPEDVAIVHSSEAEPPLELTWGALARLTGRVRAGLGSLGVGHGDRVVGYLPNIPESVAIFLACSSLGAIWSSCSPEMEIGRAHV